MEFGQNGRVLTILLAPADLATPEGQARLSAALCDCLGPVGPAALSLDLTECAGPEMAPSGPGIAQACLALAEADCPVAAGVAGILGGAPLALALAAQYRLGAPDCHFICPEIGQGRLPRAGTLARLTAILTSGPALGAMMFGQGLPAERAEAAGLLDGIASGPPGLAATTLCRKLLNHKAGPRDIAPPPGPPDLSVLGGALPPSLGPRQARALGAALSAVAAPLAQAMRHADALDDALARGGEASTLAAMARMEAGARRPITGQAPTSVAMAPAPDGHCGLTRALTEAGLSLNAGTPQVAIHLDADRRAGVWVFASGRVPVALAGPDHKPALIEIGPGIDAAQTAAAQLAQRIGALPLVSPGQGQGGPGLCMMLLDAALDAADRCVEDGASLDQVDAALCGQGWRAGPYQLADAAGHLGRLARRAAAADTRDPRGRHVPLIERLWQVRPAGRGWANCPQPVRDRIVQDIRDAAGAPDQSLGLDACAEAVTLAVTLTALRLAEHVAPEAITLAAVHGLGLPRHIGGPFAALDPVRLETRRRIRAAQEPAFWRRPMLLDRMLAQEAASTALPVSTLSR